MLRRAASIAFLGAVAFVLPLLYSNRLIDPALLPRFLLLAVVLNLATLGIAVGVLRGEVSLPAGLTHRWLVLWLLGYFAWSAISLTRSTNPGEGLFELSKIFLYLALFCVCYALAARDDRFAVSAVQAVVVSSLAVGVIAILQYYGIPLPESLGRPTTRADVASTMANRNLLSAFLLLGLPFAVWGGLRLKGAWRLGAALSFTLTTFLILVLQTRATWVALAFSSAVTSLLAGLSSLKRRVSTVGWRRPSREVTLIALFILGTIGIGVIAGTRGGTTWPMLARVESIGNLEDASIHERLMLWKKTLRMTLDHPIGGVGLGDWKIEMPGYGLAGTRAELGAVHYVRPHNDLLWVAAETGIPGALFYLLVFVFALGYGARAAWRSLDSGDHAWPLFLIFGVLAFLIDSQFSFPRERIDLSVLLMLLLALILRAHDGTCPRRSSLGRPQSLAIATCIFALTIPCAFMGWSRLNSERHAWKALEARARNDNPNLVREITRAVSPFYVMDPTAAPLLWYRGVANFTLGNLELALEDFAQASKVHPHHLHVLNNLGTCLEMSGSREDAIRLYEEALRVSPVFDPARINLAAIYYNAGRYQEAHDAILGCVDTTADPRYKEYLQKIDGKLAAAQ